MPNELLIAVEFYLKAHDDHDATREEVSIARLEMRMAADDARKAADGEPS